MINIINENFFNGIKTLNDNSIDMVLTDPPYFLDSLDEKWNLKELKKRKSEGVIKNLPKGMKFDKKQSYKFQKFYLDVSREIFRVLKPGGLFLSFSSPRLYHRMAVSVEDSGFEIRDMIGWIYTQSQAKAFSQNHFIDKMKISDDEKHKLKEKVSGLKTLQLKPAIEPICMAQKPKEGKTMLTNFIKYNVGFLNSEEKQGINNDKFPSNIITTDEISDEYDSVFLVKKPDKKEKGNFNIHISVKPVNLCEHLIKLFTKEGSIVMDPFLGSGTTAVACKNTNRNFIGYEMIKEYYNVAIKRCGE